LWVFQIVPLPWWEGLGEGEENGGLASKHRDTTLAVVD
jgi:hypothetical protein